MERCVACRLEKTCTSRVRDCFRDILRNPNVKFSDEEWRLIARCYIDLTALSEYYALKDLRERTND